MKRSPRLSLAGLALGGLLPGRCTRAAGYLALACTALFHAPSSAQTFSGTVVEEGSETPVGGALVSLENASGQQIGGTLTSPQGTFTVNAPGPGTYAVRVERIGYADWLSSTREVAAADRILLTVRVPLQPVELAELRIDVRRTCVEPGTGTGDVSQVWAEARKALETTIRAAEVQGLSFDLSEHDSWLNATSLRVEKSDRRHRRNVRLPPFDAPNPSELFRDGYARFYGDSAIYFAPDASTLLSDSFHSSHCFGLSRSVGDTSNPLIGLTFSPGAERSVPDIEGVVWLSERTAALQRVEFRYVNVPLPRGAEARLVGGEVRFARLQDGPFYVSEWWLRFPVVGQYYVDLPGADRTRTTLAAYREVGGNVTAAYHNGHPILGGERQPIVGSVTDSLTGATIPFAQVSFRDWESVARFAPGAREPLHVATADSAGVVQITNLPAGSYAVDVRWPSLSFLQLPPVNKLLTVERGDTLVSLHPPSLESVYTQLCSGTNSHRLGAIVGLTEPRGDHPAESVVVRATWARASSSESVEAKPDASGVFVLCQVPLGVDVNVQWVGTEAFAKIQLRRRVARLDLDVP